MLSNGLTCTNTCKPTYLELLRITYIHNVTHISIHAPYPPTKTPFPNPYMVSRNALFFARTRTYVSSSQPFQCRISMCYATREKVLAQNTSRHLYFNGRMRHGPLTSKNEPTCLFTIVLMLHTTTTCHTSWRTRMLHARVTSTDEHNCLLATVLMSLMYASYVISWRIRLSHSTYE